MQIWMGKMTTSVLKHINIFFYSESNNYCTILPIVANFFYSGHWSSNTLLVSCQSGNYVLLRCITKMLIVILYFEITCIGIKNKETQRSTPC